MDIMKQHPPIAHSKDSACELLPLDRPAVLTQASSESVEMQLTGEDAAVLHGVVSQLADVLLFTSAAVPPLLDGPATPSKVVRLHSFDSGLGVTQQNLVVAELAIHLALARRPAADASTPAFAVAGSGGAAQGGFPSPLSGAARGRSPVLELPSVADLSWAASTDADFRAELLQLVVDVACPNVSLSDTSTLRGRIRRLLAARDRRALQHMSRVHEVVVSCGLLEAGIAARCALDGIACATAATDAGTVAAAVAVTAGSVTGPVREPSQSDDASLPQSDDASAMAVDDSHSSNRLDVEVDPPRRVTGTVVSAAHAGLVSQASGWLPVTARGQAALAHRLESIIRSLSGMVPPSLMSSARLSPTPRPRRSVRVQQQRQDPSGGTMPSRAPGGFDLPQQQEQQSSLMSVTIDDGDDDAHTASRSMNKDRAAAPAAAPPPSSFANQLDEYVMLDIPILDMLLRHSSSSGSFGDDNKSIISTLWSLGLEVAPATVPTATLTSTSIRDPAKPQSPPPIQPQQLAPAAVAAPNASATHQLQLAPSAPPPPPTPVTQLQLASAAMEVTHGIRYVHTGRRPGELLQLRSNGSGSSGGAQLQLKFGPDDDLPHGVTIADVAEVAVVVPPGARSDSSLVAAEEGPGQLQKQQQHEVEQMQQQQQQQQVEQKEPHSLHSELLERNNDVDALSIASARSAATNDAPLETTSAKSQVEVTRGPRGGTIVAGAASSQVEVRIPGLRIVGIRRGSAAASHGRLRCNDVIIAVTTPNFNLARSTPIPNFNLDSEQRATVHWPLGVSDLRDSLVATGITLPMPMTAASGATSVSTISGPSLSLTSDPSSHSSSAHSPVEGWNVDAFNAVLQRQLQPQHAGGGGGGDDGGATSTLGGGDYATSTLVIARPALCMALESVMRGLDAGSCVCTPWPAPPQLQPALPTAAATAAGAAADAAPKPSPAPTSKSDAAPKSSIATGDEVVSDLTRGHEYKSATILHDVDVAASAAPGGSAVKDSAAPASAAAAPVEDRSGSEESPAAAAPRFSDSASLTVPALYAPATADPAAAAAAAPLDLSSPLPILRDGATPSSGLHMGVEEGSFRDVFDADSGLYCGYVPSGVDKVDAGVEQDMPGGWNRHYQLQLEAAQGGKPQLAASRPHRGTAAAAAKDYDAAGAAAATAVHALSAGDAATAAHGTNFSATGTTTSAGVIAALPGADAPASSSLVQPPVNGSGSGHWASSQKLKSSPARSSLKRKQQSSRSSSSDRAQAEVAGAVDDEGGEGTNISATAAQQRYGGVSKSKKQKRSVPTSTSTSFMPPPTTISSSVNSSSQSSLDVVVGAGAGGGPGAAFGIDSLTFSAAFSSLTEKRQPAHLAASSTEVQLGDIASSSEAEAAATVPAVAASVEDFAPPAGAGQLQHGHGEGVAAAPPVSSAPPTSTWIDCAAITRAAAAGALSSTPLPTSTSIAPASPALTSLLVLKQGGGGITRRDVIIAALRAEWKYSRSLSVGGALAQIPLSQVEVRSSEGGLLQVEVQPYATPAGEGADQVGRGDLTDAGGATSTSGDMAMETDAAGAATAADESSATNSGGGGINSGVRGIKRITHTGAVRVSLRQLQATSLRRLCGAVGLEMPGDKFTLVWRLRHLLRSPLASSTSTSNGTFEHVSDKLFPALPASGSSSTSTLFSALSVPSSLLWTVDIPPLAGVAEDAVLCAFYPFADVVLPLAMGERVAEAAQLLQRRAATAARAAQMTTTTTLLPQYVSAATAAARTGAPAAAVAAPTAAAPASSVAAVVATAATAETGVERDAMMQVEVTGHSSSSSSGYVECAIAPAATSATAALDGGTAGAVLQLGSDMVEEVGSRARHASPPTSTSTAPLSSPASEQTTTLPPIVNVALSTSTTSAPSPPASIFSPSFPKRDRRPSAKLLEAAKDEDEVMAMQVATSTSAAASSTAGSVRPLPLTGRSSGGGAKHRASISGARGLAQVELGPRPQVEVKSEATTAATTTAAETTTSIITTGTSTSRAAAPPSPPVQVEAVPPPPTSSATRVKAAEVGGCVTSTLNLSAMFGCVGEAGVSAAAAVTTSSTEVEVTTSSSVVASTAIEASVPVIAADIGGGGTAAAPTIIAIPSAAVAVSAVLPSSAAAPSAAADSTGNASSSTSTEGRHAAASPEPTSTSTVTDAEREAAEAMASFLGSFTDAQPLQLGLSDEVEGSATTATSTAISTASTSAASQTAKSATTTGGVAFPLPITSTSAPSGAPLQGGTVPSTSTSLPTNQPLIHHHMIWPPRAQQPTAISATQAEAAPPFPYAATTAEPQMQQQLQMLQQQQQQQLYQPRAPFVGATATATPQGLPQPNFMQLQQQLQQQHKLMFMSQQQQQLQLQFQQQHTAAASGTAPTSTSVPLQFPPFQLQQRMISGGAAAPMFPYMHQLQLQPGGPSGATPISGQPFPFSFPMGPRFSNMTLQQQQLQQMFPSAGQQQQQSLAHVMAMPTAAAAASTAVPLPVAPAAAPIASSSMTLPVSLPLPVASAASSRASSISSSIFSTGANFNFSEAGSGATAPARPTPEVEVSTPTAGGNARSGAVTVATEQQQLQQHSPLNFIGTGSGGGEGAPATSSATGPSATGAGTPANFNMGGATPSSQLQLPYPLLPGLGATPAQLQQMLLQHQKLFQQQQLVHLQQAQQHALTAPSSNSPSAKPSPSQLQLAATAPPSPPLQLQLEAPAASVIPPAKAPAAARRGSSSGGGGGSRGQKAAAAVGTGGGRSRKKIEVGSGGGGGTTGPAVAVVGREGIRALPSSSSSFDLQNAGSGDDVTESDKQQQQHLSSAVSAVTEAAAAATEGTASANAVTSASGAAAALSCSVITSSGPSAAVVGQLQLAASPPSGGGFRPRSPSDMPPNVTSQLQLGPGVMSSPGRSSQGEVAAHSAQLQLAPGSPARDGTAVQLRLGDHQQQQQQQSSTAPPSPPLNNFNLGPSVNFNLSQSGRRVGKTTKRSSEGSRGKVTGGGSTGAVPRISTSTSGQGADAPLHSESLPMMRDKMDEKEGAGLSLSIATAAREAVVAAAPASASKLSKKKKEPKRKSRDKHAEKPLQPVGREKRLQRGGAQVTAAPGLPSSSTAAISASSGWSSLPLDADNLQLGTTLARWTFLPPPASASEWRRLTQLQLADAAGGRTAAAAAAGSRGEPLTSTKRRRVGRSSTTKVEVVSAAAVAAVPASIPTFATAAGTVNAPASAAAPAEGISTNLGVAPSNFNVDLVDGDPLEPGCVTLRYLAYLLSGALAIELGGGEKYMRRTAAANFNLGQQRRGRRTPAATTAAAVLPPLTDATLGNDAAASAGADAPNYTLHSGDDHGDDPLNFNLYCTPYIQSLRAVNPRATVSRGVLDVVLGHPAIGSSWTVAGLHDRLLRHQVEVVGRGGHVEVLAPSSRSSAAVEVRGGTRTSTCMQPPVEAVQQWLPVDSGWDPTSTTDAAGVGGGDPTSTSLIALALAPPSVLLARIATALTSTCVQSVPTPTSTCVTRGALCRAPALSPQASLRLVRQAIALRRSVTAAMHSHQVEIGRRSVTALLALEGEKIVEVRGSWSSSISDGLVGDVRLGLLQLSASSAAAVAAAAVPMASRRNSGGGPPSAPLNFNLVPIVAPRDADPAFVNVAPALQLQQRQQPQRCEISSPRTEVEGSCSGRGHSSTIREIGPHTDVEVGGLWGSHPFDSYDSGGGNSTLRTLVQLIRPEDVGACAAAHPPIARYLDATRPYFVEAISGREVASSASPATLSSAAPLPPSSTGATTSRRFGIRCVGAMHALTRCVAAAAASLRAGSGAHGGHAYDEVSGGWKWRPQLSCDPPPPPADFNLGQITNFSLSQVGGAQDVVSLLKPLLQRMQQQQQQRDISGTGADDKPSSCDGGSSSSSSSPTSAAPVLECILKAAQAEASRRRLGALVVELTTRGLHALALQVASWLPPSVPVYEGNAASNFNLGSTSINLSSVCVPLDRWPLPFRTQYINTHTSESRVEGGDFNFALPRVVVSLSSQRARRLSTSTSVDTLLHRLQTFVVTGWVLTPFGQRLCHPAAVVQFATGAAAMCVPKFKLGSVAEARGAASNAS